MKFSEAKFAESSTLVHQKPAEPIAGQILPDNPFKFIGKEKAAGSGLSLYDFGARWYNPATPAWLAPDPLSEKYYPITPFCFCHDNPINYVDINGCADDKWFWRGAGLIVKGTVETLSGTGAASTGAGAGIGAFLVIDGVSSIGLGITTIMISFAPETENRNDATLDIMTSDILEIVGKSLDKGAQNETPDFEVGAEVISSAISIGSIKSLKPTSISEAISEAITVLQIRETAQDIYKNFPTNNQINMITFDQNEDISTVLDKWREAINSLSLWKQ